MAFSTPYTKWGTPGCINLHRNKKVQLNEMKLTNNRSPGLKMTASRPNGAFSGILSSLKNLERVKILMSKRGRVGDG
jgi:hypothetical protein